MTASRSDRVRPAQDWGAPIVQDIDASVLCGHRALAYVLGEAVEQVVRWVGHGTAMRLREIQRVIRVHSGFAPIYVGGDVLANDPTRLWWAHGGQQFLAILAAVGRGESLVDGAIDTTLGHVVVLHGRTLLDPAGDARGLATEVSPTILARYQLAIILSVRGSS